MIKLAILIPVLRRPQNIYPLISSIKDSTKEPYQVIFIVSPGDREEITELENQTQSFIMMDANYENRGDYAKKINKGFNAVEAEWYFLGADDIKFHPKWFEWAMKAHQKTDACVIGTNDLGNPSVLLGEHSTHSLVLGDYISRCGTIDEPGKILHTGYHHNFCDSELIETAKWRGAWSFSRNSWVEHLHFQWKKGKKDDVYEIGQRDFRLDQQYFEERKKLWI